MIVSFNCQARLSAEIRDESLSDPLHDALNVSVFHINTKYIVT